MYFVKKVFEKWKKKLTKGKCFDRLYLASRKWTQEYSISASGSVGGARPCQGRGRGFESRLALWKTRMIRKYHPYFFRVQSWTRRFEVSASLRSSQNWRPPDVMRRLALLRKNKFEIALCFGCYKAGILAEYFCTVVVTNTEKIC